MSETETKPDIPDREELIQQIIEYEFGPGWKPDPLSTGLGSLVALLRVLIKKGIVTDEEVEQMYQEYMREKQREEAVALADRMIEAGQTFEQHVRLSEFMKGVGVKV
jgi:hypothetical protein